MSVAVVFPLRSEYRLRLTPAQNAQSPINVNVLSGSRADLTSALTAAGLFLAGDVLTQDVVDSSANASYWKVLRSGELVALVRLANGQ